MAQNVISSERKNSSDQVKETKKVKEKNFSKGKGKGNVEKTHNHIHQEAAGPGHNSGPPTQQTHII